MKLINKKANSATNEFNQVIVGNSLTKDAWRRLKKNKMAVIFGNESKGVSFEVSTIANEQVSISKIGEAESLNVGVAFAIFCHELCS